MRRLRLTREALCELRTDELKSVAGGTHVGCVTHGDTSCDACPTVPVNFCVDIAATPLCPTTPLGGQP